MLPKLYKSIESVLYISVRYKICKKFPQTNFWLSVYQTLILFYHIHTSSGWNILILCIFILNHQ